ncbi:MAG TPA: hypothetical protein VHJ20_10680 [Polyangia bacterium]|nr:hypothetical protein [Polyangia bacterium]
MSAAPSRRPSRARRALKAAVATTALLVAFVGFLHTKAGRPILAALGVGCPAMRVSPSEVEALRQRALTQLRGARPAAARPALGLALDGSTEADVTSWTQVRGLRCEAGAKPTRHLTCRDVPAAALPPTDSTAPVDELSFTFFANGRLLGVETLRRHLTGDEAARAFGAITGALDGAVGAPTERAGTATGEYLGGGASHTAFARYRYADYLATVTAMNLSGRVALREQYQSARAPS